MYWTGRSSYSELDSMLVRSDIFVGGKRLNCLPPENSSHQTIERTQFHKDIGTLDLSEYKRVTSVYIQ